MMRGYTAMGLAAVITVTACRPAEQKHAPAAASAVSASVVAVVRRDVGMNVQVPVTLESYYQTELASRVTAHVRELRVDVGDAVKHGDVLAVLEAEELTQRANQARERIAVAEQGVREQQASIEAWEAQFHEAEAHRAAATALLAQRKTELQRTQQLVAFGSLKQARQDEAGFAAQAAEAELKAAAAGVDAIQARRSELAEKLKSAQSMVAVRQAEYGEAHAMVDYLQLRAPFDGIVTKRNTDPGVVVRPPSDGGSALLTVEQVSPLRVVCFLPMRDAEELDVGDSLAIQSLSRSGAQSQEPLEIARIARSFDRQSRMMRAEAELANPENNGVRKFRPGDYGKATLTLKVFRSAIVVPPESIVDNDGATFVMIVRADKSCRRVAVRVPYQTDSQAVVEPLQMEINDGDFVIVDQPGQFHDGQKLDELRTSK